MKVFYFCDETALKTTDAYNKWAQNKVLAKDVIIHTHITPDSADYPPTLAIVVFFDERMHPEWIGKAEAPQTSTIHAEM
jgi:hypothetical protein